MGLFINNEQHYSMYKNAEELIEPNQTTFRRDHLSELLKEQQKNNDLIHKSIHQLSMFTKRQDDRQSIQWQEVNSRLSGLEKVNNQQEVQIMEQLKALTNENEKVKMMMENKGISDQEIINQMKQHSLNKEEITQQIIEQKESQKEVLTRLEDQEALTEKALRQMSNLRSSLFERTNYLAERIESSYQLTSSYLYQLLTGTDQPLTFYLHNENNKEKANQDK